MKNKFKLFIKTFIVSSLVCVIFIATGYLYLSKSFKEADNEVENIPYSQTLSENKGILLLCNGESVFFYLDFLENKVIVSLNPEKSDNGLIYGYTYDYTLDVNSALISDIIDYIGGVELSQDGEKIRYTGFQANDLLKQSNSKELRREIIKDIGKKIAFYGVDNEFFSILVNNSKTELKFSECYLWRDYLRKMCDNLNFID